MNAGDDRKTYANLFENLKVNSGIFCSTALGFMCDSCNAVPEYCGIQLDLLYAVYPWRKEIIIFFQVM